MWLHRKSVFSFPCINVRLELQLLSISELNREASIMKTRFINLNVTTVCVPNYCVCDFGSSNTLWDFSEEWK